MYYVWMPSVRFVSCSTPIPTFTFCSAHRTAPSLPTGPGRMFSDEIRIACPLSVSLNSPPIRLLSQVPLLAREFSLRFRQTLA